MNKITITLEDIIELIIKRKTIEDNDIEITKITVSDSDGAETFYQNDFHMDFVYKDKL